MGFSLILRAFFSFPNERQFIECQFFWEFRINVRAFLVYLENLLLLPEQSGIAKIRKSAKERV